MKKRIMLFITLAAFAFADGGQKGSFTDPRDGKTYKTVKIGNQVWMAENLNYETDSSYCYEDKKFFCHKFGRLYSWNAAMQACPAGWHLPSDNEWQTLFDAVRGKSGSGKVLKAESGWMNYKDKRGDGTDDFGYSAFPAGYRDDCGDFSSAGKYAFFWSSAEKNCLTAYKIGLRFFDESASLAVSDKDVAFSVRCLRDDNTKSSIAETKGCKNVNPLPPIDEQNLNLFIAVTEDYMVIGTRGAFLPSVYYTVQNGRYVAIAKKSEEDPGRMIWAVYSSKNGRPDSVYVDENNYFLLLLGEGDLGMEPPKNLKLPNPGTYLSTLALNSQRKLKSGDAVIAPLSVFDVIAKDLASIHTDFIDFADVDEIVMIFNDDFFGNDRLHELRPLIGAIKGAGFKKSSLATLGSVDIGYREFIAWEAYQELYKPFGLHGVLKLLTVPTTTSNYTVNDLMRDQQFSKDIDKMLKDVAGL